MIEKRLILSGNTAFKCGKIFNNLSNDNFDINYYKTCKNNFDEIAQNHEVLLGSRDVNKEKTINFNVTEKFFRTSLHTANIMLVVIPYRGNSPVLNAFIKETNELSNRRCQMF